MLPARQVVSALGAAVRNENVRRVELAWGASIAAEWAYFVALGVFAYQQGGASAVGIAGLVRLLPAAVVAPFAASLGDRFRRERFLLALMLLGSAALAGSAAAAYADSELLVFALAAVVGLSSTLVRPALQALLPSLARTPEELIASNGATSTVESLGTLIGPFVAGLLVSFANVGLVFVVGAGALLAAAGLLLRVRVEGRIELGAAGEDGNARRMVEDGFRAIARTPNARLVIGLITAQAFVRGCLNVLIVIAAFRLLHGSASYGRDRRGRAGRSLWGDGTRWSAARGSLRFGARLLGSADRAHRSQAVLRSGAVPARDRGRRKQRRGRGGLHAAPADCPRRAPHSCARHCLGLRPAFVAVGSILPLLTLLTYGRLVHIDRTVAPPPELELVDHVPMFAPLSLAGKERVAVSLVQVAVAAGELVISAGDVGDRFYIVADGELEIDADGLRSTAHRADYFGEIALLRDVPRTASVKASTDSRLYALQRDDFLAAVTGHAAAHAAGQAVAEERLGQSNDHLSRSVTRS